MRRAALALALLAAVTACRAPGVTYHVDPSAPAGHYEALLECVAAYQPLVPFGLAVQRGGLPPADATARYVTVEAPERVVVWGHVALGEHDRDRDVLRVTRDADLLRRNEFGHGRDWIVRSVTCHEVGHTLSLEHEDCPAGVMGYYPTRESPDLPGACEAARLEALHHD
jgi:hypothetical protein